jgi:hypothetical protein
VADDAVLIQQANYEEHMDVLGECDLIIEAIAERMDWKLDLYKKIAPFVGRTPSSRPTHRACRSPSCRKRCPKKSSRGSAASTSSTRRATWRWWS